MPLTPSGDWEVSIEAIELITRFVGEYRGHWTHQATWRSVSIPLTHSGLLEVIIEAIELIRRLGGQYRCHLHHQAGGQEIWKSVLSPLKSSGYLEVSIGAIDIRRFVDQYRGHWPHQSVWRLVSWLLIYRTLRSSAALKNCSSFIKPSVLYRVIYKMCYIELYIKCSLQNCLFYIS
jgi:hypothetical protein